MDRAAICVGERAEWDAVDIYRIVKNCRTSVEMIEKFYAAHIKNTLDTTMIVSILLLVSFGASDSIEQHLPELGILVYRDFCEDRDAIPADAAFSANKEGVDFVFFARAKGANPIAHFSPSPQM